MTMNAISVKGFGGAAPGGGGGSSPLWMTVVADVSVRNPNAASLRYAGSKTAVYYRAARVGGASGPPGTARARRTVRLNVTVSVAVGALLGTRVPRRRRGGRRRGDHGHDGARARGGARRRGAPARGAGDELHGDRRRRRHVHPQPELPAESVVVMPCTS